MYDQRLFNQEGGMASGLASDDTYNLYDKALFADRGNNLYKPRNNNPDDDAADPNGQARTFKPDKARHINFESCSPELRMDLIMKNRLKTHFGIVNGIVCCSASSSTHW